ncbi:glycerophosphodiester phosphodiesterase family protein [uncultured Kocuria sp.]|uniref:glycerophosphodiester phosphodiesterase family protein n=1 Tax=uncultured Kocuria sp. TaxID=259305 RepID=UPI0026222AAA|nr:glycerophosphodiester phosphodiesterase family protein [uncultured Kocuria sp.]
MSTPRSPFRPLHTAAAGALSAVALIGVSAPAVAAPTATVPAAPPAASVAAEDRPLVIGHRGAAGTAPENTVSAFKDARAAGVDYLEIDVQLSADGVPFLFHDNTPARTTNVAEVFPGREHDPITSFTWAELQQLDAGSSFDQKFAGEKIPHLDDAAKVATVNTGVYIEIKSPTNSPGIEQVVAESLAQDKDWAQLLAAGKVTVIGFDETSNRAFAALAPEVPLQQLTGTVPDTATLERWAGFVDSVGTNYRALDAEGVTRVDAAGLDLGVYTVNSPEAVQAVIDLGVDMVTGDFPIQTGRYLDGQNPYPAEHGVQIADSVNDVPGNDLQPEIGEHVVLTNTGPRTVDVSGWLLRDAANNVLAVGEGYELAPGAQLRIHTGPGTDTEGAYYNGGTGSVLNNGGDSVALWTDEDTLQDVFAN